MFLGLFMSIALSGGHTICNVVLLRLSSQFYIQWLNMDKLKSALVEVFTPWKLLIVYTLENDGENVN